MIQGTIFVLKYLLVERIDSLPSFSKLTPIAISIPAISLLTLL